MHKDQIEAIEALWNCVAALPEDHMKVYIRDLREVAKLLKMDPHDFYENTGGYDLYTPEEIYEMKGHS